jgi:minor extracellular serine protease Vpr
MSFRRLHWFFLLIPLAASAAVPNRYIVEMTGEPVAAHVARRDRASGMRGAAARQRRAEIRAEQQRLRGRLEGAEARVLDSVDTVANALVVEIADEKAAALASIPGVARVHPVRIFKPLLDRAVVIHRVTEAWQSLGIENAGAGVKIAIIDTGIDQDHPGFRDPSLPLPEGFPRAGRDEDLAFTNSKVIVARSYTSLLPVFEPDPSPRDRVGHGTATAMAAAGVLHSAPLAAIGGVAPKAQLGNYKVFGSPGINDGATSSAILKAIDDAVADGMDIISLSLGTVEAPRVGDDLEALALERASELGIIVVAAAGNEGPDPNTIGSPGTAPSAITVGAWRNDRTFGGSAVIGDAAPVLAIPRQGTDAMAAPVTGQLASVAALDGDGMACSPLPASSLNGRIAFMLRGVCTFEEKLNHAQRAGAIAALVYTDAERPDPIEMGIETATLPASMISYADGVKARDRLAENPALTATIVFTLTPVISGTQGLAGFSSKGPSVELGIKPDLVAVGTSFYTAAQTYDPRGSLYSATGYTQTQGTSFSTPFVAGAAALLKSARPGLTAAQYRSLIVNNAAAANGTLQQTGNGALDVGAALRATATAVPASLNFQAGGPDADIARDLTVTNIGAGHSTFQLTAVASEGAPIPALEIESIDLDPGASARIAVRFAAFSLAPGQYEGLIRITDTATGAESRVPYWYAVRSEEPKYITVLDVRESGSPLATLRDAVLFRITDPSGLPIAGLEPVASVVSGGGLLVNLRSIDDRIPGAFSLTLRLGARRGANVVRIEAGGVTRDVTVTSR